MRRSGGTEHRSRLHKYANVTRSSAVLDGGEARQYWDRKPFSSRPVCGAGRTYYRLIWGVDDLSVKWAESGEVIRFTYEVLDPAKAKELNDKKIEPSLIDERAHVKLVIPQMDKVGKLRQTTNPKRGRSIGCCFRIRADMSSAETE